MPYVLNDLVKTLRPSIGSAFSRPGERGFISKVIAQERGPAQYLMEGLTVGVKRHSGGMFPENHLMLDPRADLRAAKIAYDAGVRALENNRRDQILRRTMEFQRIAILHGIPIVDVRAIVMAALQFNAEEAYKNYLVSSPFDIDLTEAIPPATPPLEAVHLVKAAAKVWTDKTPIDGMPALTP